MRLILLALIGLILAGCASVSAPRPAELTGRVHYLERTALPRPGVLRVTLEDISLAGAPAVVIAEQTIDVVEGSGPPFAFVLRYDPARIERRRVYAVRAQGRDAGGELRATTTESYRVLTRGAPRTLDVTLYATPSTPTPIAPQEPATAPPRAGAGDFNLRRRGVDFVAIGQEPGWQLHMFANRLELSYDYGNVELSAPRPQPILPAWQGEIYETQAGGRRITVTIRRTPCQDAMSGETFPAHVTVAVDQRTLEGCGRPL